MFNIGNLIKFTSTGETAVIVDIQHPTCGSEWAILFHNVEGIPNPTGFTISELRRTAEVVNEAR